MDVVATGPLKYGGLRHTDGSSWYQTVFAKLTYQLAPGVSPLAPKRVALLTQDELEGALCRAPADLVPRQARAQVTLVGSAVAPGGQPATRVVCRLIVGEIDKAIAVHADRLYHPRGEIEHGAPFRSQRLGFDRAAGGPDTWNPVGLGPHLRDAGGRVRLPNQLPPGLVLDRPDDRTPIASFGPIPAMWRRRSSGPGWTSGPCETADGMLLHPAQLSTFCSAMDDQQQPDPFAPDLRLVLEGLVVGHERFVTNLVRMRPQAVLSGRGRNETRDMTPWALWIDSDQQLATLTFSAQFSLTAFDEPGRVVLGLDSDGGEATITNTSDSGSGPAPLPFRPDAAAGLPAPEPASPRAVDAGATQPIAIGRLASFREVDPAPPPRAEPAPAAPSPPAPAFRAVSALEREQVLTATSASNAALHEHEASRPKLAPAPRDSAARAPRGDGQPLALALVWFEPSVVERVASKGSSGQRPLRDLARPNKASDVSPPALVARALRRMDPALPHELPAALSAALRSSDTRGEPVLVEGELHVELDLSAQVQVAAALLADVPGHDASMVARAQKLADAPWTSRPALEACLAKLTDAARRADLPWDRLIRSALLEQRRFARTTVFGAPHLAFRWSFGPRDAQLTLYAPEAAADHLPARPSLGARALAFVVPLQSEAGPTRPALLLAALAELEG